MLIIFWQFVPVLSFPGEGIVSMSKSMKRSKSKVLAHTKSTGELVNASYVDVFGIWYLVSGIVSLVPSNVFLTGQEYESTMHGF